MLVGGGIQYTFYKLCVLRWCLADVQTHLVMCGQVQS
jgi:hypothetical protein